MILRHSGRAAGFAILSALSGCNYLNDAGCSSEISQATVIDLVRSQIEQAVSNQVRGDDGVRTVGSSKIRAALAELVIALDDIRTSKSDPNSTKKFCTATLRVRFPSDALTDADKARAAAGENDVSDLASDLDVERAADSFTTSIEFNVQPTDDRSKVFAEAEGSNAMYGFAAQVVASSLLRSAIEGTRREQDQAVAQQAAAENAAADEQKKAGVEAARADNQLAAQTIAASWKAIDDGTRARLLPAQRAWIRKKDADCGVEAASASVDPTERETARLQCDTRVTQDRTSWLAQFRSDSGSTTSIAPEPVTPVSQPVPVSRDDF
ncbi:lysozyme inhibitor LprI family protein [Sphingomonas sp.]|uniref:lysozyme inhibitor LprI family protein n=1 Tax=Sphingomonas sp. TaxID=28214 RepID=UPI0035C78D10